LTCPKKRREHRRKSIGPKKKSFVTQRGGPNSWDKGVGGQKELSREGDGGEMCEKMCHDATRIEGLFKPGDARIRGMLQGSAILRPGGGGGRSDRRKDQGWCKIFRHVESPPVVVWLASDSPTKRIFGGGGKNVQGHRVNFRTLRRKDGGKLERWTSRKDRRGKGGLDLEFKGL